mgnify:CR=1 FL=1
MAFSVEVNLKDSETPALTKLALTFAGEKQGKRAGQPMFRDGIHCGPHPFFQIERTHLLKSS